MKLYLMWENYFVLSKELIEILKWMEEIVCLKNKFVE